MRSTLVKVSKLGIAYLPEKYSHIYSNNPIRQFDLNKKSRNHSLKYLKQGGIPVLKGDWKKVSTFYREVLKFEKELLPKTADARQRKLFSRQLKERVLTEIDSLTHEQAYSFTCDELAGFVGESTLPSNIPTLIPVRDAEKILNIPSNISIIKSLGIRIITHNDVLAPRSQETINLMCKAIQESTNILPSNPKVLDMGCGSGVLSIATYLLLKSWSPDIIATDILKEAIATTKLNIRHNLNRTELKSNSITTASSGDLFDPVQGQRFDLIIFNAPWIIAPAKNRAELALNDSQQRTIKRFFADCSTYLTPNGRVIVGYSNNSGRKAIEKFEMYLKDAGLEILQINKDRIKTYRSKRPWQNIYAYVLRSKVNFN